MGKHKDHNKKKGHGHKNHKHEKHDKKHNKSEKQDTFQVLGVNRPIITAQETKVNGKSKNRKGANYQQVPNQPLATNVQSASPQNVQKQAPLPQNVETQTAQLGPYGPYNPQTVNLQPNPTDGVWAGAGTAFPNPPEPGYGVPINGELPVAGSTTSQGNEIVWKEVKVHRGRRRYKVPCLKGAYYNAHHWFPYPFYAKKDCAGSSYSCSSSSSSSSSWY